jgi:hypothetical protein
LRFINYEIKNSSLTFLPEICPLFSRITSFSLLFSAEWSLQVISYLHPSLHCEQIFSVTLTYSNLSRIAVIASTESFSDLNNFFVAHSLLRLMNKKALQGDHVRENLEQHAWHVK